MDVKVESRNAHHQDEEKAPLLRDAASDRQSLVQKAIAQTFKSTAHLANLLPTGTVLTFQLLAPIFANQGHCNPIGRFMTGSLVALCGLSCFLLSFTDSFRDEKGNVFHGFATYRGLWVVDGPVSLPPEVGKKYRLCVIDFIHAFLSVLVFAAIALFEQNVVGCFYPTPSVETQEILAVMPVGIGIIGSMLFVVFPTKRHGIGFPLSSK